MRWIRWIKFAVGGSAGPGPTYLGCWIPARWAGNRHRKCAVMIYRTMLLKYVWEDSMISCSTLDFSIPFVLCDVIFKSWARKIPITFYQWQWQILRNAVSHFLLIAFLSHSIGINQWNWLSSFNFITPSQKSVPEGRRPSRATALRSNASPLGRSNKITNLTTVSAEVVLTSDVGPCQPQHLLEDDKWSNGRIAQPSHPLVTQEHAQEADHLLLPPGQGLGVHDRLLLWHLLQPSGGLTWAQEGHTQQRLWSLNTVWWCHLRLIRTKKNGSKYQDSFLLTVPLALTFSSRG